MSRGIGRQIMFFPFFIIMMTALVGIWLGVVSFYGKGYDFRYSESALLGDDFKDCFLESSENFFSEDFDVFSSCGFNQNVIEDGKHLIYVKDVESEEEFFKGTYDFVNQCYFEGGVSNREFPVCESYEVLKNGKGYLVIAGSRQN